MSKQLRIPRPMLLAGLPLAMVSTYGPAWAQSGAGSASRDVGIGDIVVTAQRRSEKLNDVGISVVAASGDSLLAKGVASTADLTKIVPGLTATETPYGTPVLTLRGVGFYESSLAASSPVAAYVDEIPLPYTRMALGTSLDIQRVEVLKGPQGTLYGQNSTGGAINFIVNKPTDEFKAGFDASLGRFMDTDVQGFISGPLSNTVRARLAVRTHQSGDWQKSVSRDDTTGSTHVTMGRMLIDWQASEALTFELNLNGFIDKSDSQALAATSFQPNNPQAVQPEELAAVFTPPGDNRLADWDADKNFRRNNWYYQAALKTTFATGDSADVIAITAYQHFKQDQFVDSDGTNAEAVGSTQDGYVKSFSQELRLQGQAGRLKYVLGGNYSYDRIYDNTLYIIRHGSQAHGLDALGLDIGIGRTHSRQSAKTYAGFGNLDYELTSGLNLQAGIRYTKQTRKFEGCLGDPGPIGGGKWANLFSYIYGTTIPVGGCTTLNPATGFIGMERDSSSEDNISWRGAINYKPSPGTLLYASVAQGYKQGSFPTVGGNSSTQYTPAKQEGILAYEIGTKLSLLDRHLQLNGALFYYDYSDKQLRGKVSDIIFGTIEQLFNIPKSQVKGAELQIIAAPVTGLTLEGNLTYSDSKVKSDFPSLTPIGVATNLKGESFELTPKWAANASVNYDAPISDTINGFAGVDVNYQGRTHAGYGGDPLFTIDPYTLIDLRIGIHARDDAWRGQLWIRNLTDKYYWTNANYLGEFTYRQTGRPRTYGVSVSYRF